MIGWLIDRVWVHKNSAALQQIDAQMDGLQAVSERLDKRMEESFGPDWREKGYRRLSEVMSCRWTLE
jgi:benzoyl-CoA reductase/2-hydroxyglutaryl-CoA dehydratase subunit BcrC/BadD/HgdB